MYVSILTDQGTKAVCHRDEISELAMIAFCFQISLFFFLLPSFLAYLFWMLVYILLGKAF